MPHVQSIKDTPTMRSAFLGCALLALLATTGCGARDATGPFGSTAASAERFARSAHAAHSASGGVIQHVVYIIQENRSFNNLFMGFKGAKTQNYGYNTSGVKIKLHSQTISTNWDIDHSANGFFAAYNNGALNGWNNEYACCGQPANFAFAYAPKSETKTYWDMAKQYVLADEFFQSNLDGSYIAHQYAIAAYANGEVNFPSTDWGCQGGANDVLPTLLANRTYGPNVPVCEDYTTLGDELDQASLSWRFYTYPYNESGGLWSAYSAINHIYNGPDWSEDVITPATQFQTDVKNGDLAAVTWITPSFINSDHGGMDSTGGPAWVTSLVNTVGESQFWDSTAIFIIWDDWGGWFDPVAPIYLDYDGTGFRIPCIAISAYAKQGYVSHVQYESSSVLRFMEDNFGLAPLAASDSRAADPASDFFDFSQQPRTFVPFAKPPPLHEATGPRPAHQAVDGD
jgi:phospholipase C